MTALRLRKLQSQQGFTVIELLTVIGVIAILMGLLFVVGQRVIGGQRASATRATLNNLQGMLAEFEAADGLRTQPQMWLWTETGSVIVRVPSGTVGRTYDFWRGVTVAGPPLTYDPLISPGVVTSDSSAGLAQRSGSIAVVDTSLAMSLIASVPANRQRLGSLPQQQQFAPTWTDQNVAMPGPDFFGSTSDDPMAGTPAQYVPGAHVRLDGKYYVAKPTYTAGANVSNTTSWADETAAPFHAPILLDGWNNPIIFVPASGLRVRMLNNQQSLDPMNATQNWIVVSPEGSTLNPTTGVQTNGTATPMVSKPGRPFFASAGPDGDFTTGDDNIYSFEK